MSDIQDLISQIPIGDLAAKLGVDKATASEVVAKAIPALVGGMQVNAAAGGAASLEKAVAKHSGELVTGGVDLDKVDTADGKKIVSHVFGAKKDQVAKAAGDGDKGNLGELIGKAMPILAPIVMSFLAQKFSGTKPATSAEPGPSSSSAGGIGDLLGGLLGGAGAGGGIGGLLGGILGK